MCRLVLHELIPARKVSTFGSLLHVKTLNCCSEGSNKYHYDDGWVKGRVHDGLKLGTCWRSTKCIRYAGQILVANLVVSRWRWGGDRGNRLGQSSQIVELDFFLGFGGNDTTTMSVFFASLYITSELKTHCLHTSISFLLRVTSYSINRSCICSLCSSSCIRTVTGLHAQSLSHPKKTDT